MADEKSNFEKNVFALGAGLEAGSLVWQARVAENNSRATVMLEEVNAQTSETNERAVFLKTQFDLLRLAEAGSRTLGTLRTRLAGSGARLDVGAPLRALSEQADELELERIQTAEAGARKMASLRRDAIISRFKGKEAKAAGKQARTAGLVGAGTSLLSSFSTSKKEGFA